MTAYQRVDEAVSIKANLESLYEQLLDLELTMPAHLIGAAMEALADEIERCQPHLRLVRGGKL